MRLATAAGGALLVAPHIAGFAVRQAPGRIETSAAQGQPPVVLGHRVQRPPSAALWLCYGRREPPGRSAASRRRTWGITQAVDTYRGSDGPISAVASMTSPPGAAAPEDHERNRNLRIAVVGEGADELGRRIAGRYGLVATSMDELMKGRKGRKTDNVKAKAAAEWLAAAAGEMDVGRMGGVLTGFPATATQADSLAKQGVNLEQLVLVSRTGAVSEEPHHEANSEANSEDEEERLLTARLKGRVIKLAGQKDVDDLCDTAASLLSLARDAAPPAAAARTAAAESTTPPPSPPPPLSPPVPSLLSDADMIMRPGEHAAAHEETREIDSADPEAADRRAQSREGAEAKRARKEAMREKKRKANEAQQLDTPFYVAVAQGGPKARFRPPVPMVPSRITERLSSAVSPGGGDGQDSESGVSGGGGSGGGPVVNTRLEFGSLALDSPASDCLLAAGITEPTGIQRAGMGPILDGESVILHAMTGSGKTLAFLLPLMQRWTPRLCSSAGAGGGRRGAEEGADGADGAPWQVLLALPTRELAVQVAREVVLLSGGLTSSVELLVDASVFHDLSKVTAPIVVGSAKVLERLIRKSRPSVRDDVLPRIKCIVVDEVDRLVDVLSKHAPTREAEKRKRHARPIAALLERVLSANGEAQVVACSATIGRPLRRELGHIVRRASSLGGGSGGVVDADSGSRELRLIRDAASESTDRNLATERAVAIPDTIPAAPPHLRPAARAGHRPMGFVSDEDFGGVRGAHASGAAAEDEGVERGGGDAAAGDVLVTGEDSARGLHFDDVDFVFLMQKPKSPDEYRGTVVTLVEFEEFRKLRGWSSSLKVDFEPLDILNVVNR
ncbi:unnamed protein product [Scytosiphon promiscuus]